MNLLHRTLVLFTRTSLSLLVLITALVATLRYGFNIGWVWMQNLTSVLHGLLFLTGAALTLQADEHVRVDAWYEKQTPVRKRRIDRLGFFFFLLPFTLVILVTSIPFALQAWSVLESSSEPGGLKGIYFFKTFVPLFGVLLLAFGIRSLR